MLNRTHIKEVLDKEILIGRAKARDGKAKSLSFNAWLNEYRVTHNFIIIDSGQAEQELLNIYNEL